MRRIAFPELGENPRQWNENMTWGQLGPSDFKSIAARVADLLRGLEPKIDRFLAELHKIVPDRLGWKLVDWSQVRTENSPRAALSGTESVIGSGRHMLGE